MRDWMDLNGDGEIDGSEMMFAEEMLCTSREEHEALFGDAGDFEDDTKDDLEIDAMAAGLDIGELELMDPDDRAEALEEAGLNPDDYDLDWDLGKGGWFVWERIHLDRDWQYSVIIGVLLVISSIDEAMDEYGEDGESR